jgi:DnaJ-class molecular chaperone
MMRRDRKAKPLAVCSVCQGLTDQRANLSQRCNHVINGRRCFGTFKSAITFLWDQCESCEGTGTIARRACTVCAGFGWKLYA